MFDKALFKIAFFMPVFMITFFNPKDRTPQGCNYPVGRIKPITRSLTNGGKV